MRIQVLLEMGQDCLSKEEVGELMNQSVHVVATTQDLWNLNKNFLSLQVTNWEKRVQPASQ